MRWTLKALIPSGSISRNRAATLALGPESCPAPTDSAVSPARTAPRALMPIAGTRQAPRDPG